VVLVPGPFGCRLHSGVEKDFYLAIPRRWTQGLTEAYGYIVLASFNDTLRIPSSDITCYCNNQGIIDYYISKKPPIVYPRNAI